jgi:hypothetical protein
VHRPLQHARRLLRRIGDSRIERDGEERTAAALALLITASPAAHFNETMRLNCSEAGLLDGLLGEFRQVVEREAEFLEHRVDSRRPLLGVVALNGHSLASLTTLGREKHSAGWTVHQKKPRQRSGPYS